MIDLGPNFEKLVAIARQCGKPEFFKTDVRRALFQDIDVRRGLYQLVSDGPAGLAALRAGFQTWRDLDGTKFEVHRGEAIVRVVLSSAEEHLVRARARGERETWRTCSVCDEGWIYWHGRTVPGPAPSRPAVELELLVHCHTCSGGSTAGDIVELGSGDRVLLLRKDR